MTTQGSTATLAPSVDETLAETGHRIDWLVDNADAYRACVAMIRAAEQDIWISQLALDADCVAYDVPVDSGLSDATTVTLADELARAAERGVRVRVLLNASLLLDTVAPLRRWVALNPALEGAFLVRGVSRFPQLLHAKMLIADECDAILVGSPFANGYWDDSRHVPLDSRRPDRELGGRPVHDVSVQVAGPAVQQLVQTFVELWNHAADRSPADHEPLRALSHPRAQQQVTSSVSVAHTAPRNCTPRHRDGRMEILPALLEGIARAQSLIYIEHQYMSSRRVISALTAALAREPGLEIVVVLNQNPDVTAYRGWQNQRLHESGLLLHPRVGLFTLWSANADHESGERQLTQVFVHSKVVVIDDRWALVGSANLDGVSLHSYGADFESALGRWVFDGVRNFDVGLVLDADASVDGGEEVATAIRDLRTQLWTEHLGNWFHSYDSKQRGRPQHSEGPAFSRGAGRADPSPVAQDDNACPVLAAWRLAARENVRNLISIDTPLALRVMVLPYSTATSPRRQLGDMGMDLAKGGTRLCFNPSWMEVHVSPNWIRNMFA